MNKSLTLSALIFNILILLLFIPVNHEYRLYIGVTLFFAFLLLDLKSMLYLISLLPMNNRSPYVYGLLLLHPYTHIVILYKSGDYEVKNLLKSICSLGIYNGVWFDKLIKVKRYNFENLGEDNE